MLQKNKAWEREGMDVERGIWLALQLAISPHGYSWFSNAQKMVALIPYWREEYYIAWLMKQSNIWNTDVD